MASESVTILIDAENQASAEFKKVGQDLEGMSRRVKDVGRNTKASVEIAGTLANAFGGSAFGAFASQMAQVTERVSAFSEVAKTGTLGAMALKLGIVAAAGAVTYKVTEVVASWAFGIEKSKEAAADAEKQFVKTSAAMLKMRQDAFSNTKEDISLVRGAPERERAANEAAIRLERQARKLDAKVQKAADELARKQAALQSSWLKDRAVTDVNVAKDQLANMQAMRDELDAEAKSLREMVGERAKSIEARKEENALAEKSDSFIKGLREEVELLKATKEERLAIEAARNATPEQRGVAEALLVEREALKAKAEEQKKAELAADLAAKKEEAAIQRIADLEKKRTIDLEAKRIELERGREAAQAYRLEQEGLSKATAGRLAAQEEMLRQQEDGARFKVPASTEAVESRVMSRGITANPMLDAIRKSTDEQRKTAEATAESNKILRSIYEESKKRGKVLEVELVQ